MPFPFEIEWDQDADQESFIDSVVGSLRPQTLVLPKGPGFVSYARFQEAYETLKRHTSGCQNLSGSRSWAAVEEDGLALVVLRCIAGLSPPELARLTSTDAGVAVDQGFARIWDRKLREEGILSRRLSSLTLKRLRTNSIRKPLSRPKSPKMTVRFATRSPEFSTWPRSCERRQGRPSLSRPLTDWWSAPSCATCGLEGYDRLRRN